MQHVLLQSSFQPDLTLALTLSFTLFHVFVNDANLPSPLVTPISDSRPDPTGSSGKHILDDEMCLSSPRFASGRIMVPSLFGTVRVRVGLGLP